MLSECIKFLIFSAAWLTNEGDNQAALKVTRDFDRIQLEIHDLWVVTRTLHQLPDLGDGRIGIVDSPRREEPETDWKLERIESMFRKSH